MPQNKTLTFFALQIRITFHASSSLLQNFWISKSFFLFVQGFFLPLGIKELVHSHVAAGFVSS
jgi:hypothetical protein